MNKQLNIKYLVFASLVFMLLWACNSETTYKVRRLHKGHARIAYSYGKRELPKLKDEVFIPTANRPVVDELSEVSSDETPVPVITSGTQTELVVANFTVLNRDIASPVADQYCIAPSPKPRANPFEEYVPPVYKDLTQGNESFLGYIFEDFWANLLWAAVVTILLTLLITTIIYGWAVVSAYIVAEVLPTLLVLLALAALILLAVWIESLF